LPFSQASHRRFPSGQKIRRISKNIFTFILNMITMQREPLVFCSCQNSQFSQIYPGGAGKNGLWISYLGAKSP
jgi:hypothetical protein